MQINTGAIINGEFADRFGKRGSQFSLNGMPTYSIPFDISDVPAGTQSFAVVLEDKDAITASGFVLDALADCRPATHFRCRKRQPAHYRLRSRGEQLGERAGQT